MPLKKAGWPNSGSESESALMAKKTDFAYKLLSMYLNTIQGTFFRKIEIEMDIQLKQGQGLQTT